MMTTSRASRGARRGRRGYALLLVVGFEMILLAVWGMAIRSVGSAYRVETSRVIRQTRDDGLMTALGQAVASLESALPTKDSQDQDMTSGASTAPQTIAVVTPSGSTLYFDVVFTSQGLPLDTSLLPSQWLVTVRPH